MQTLFASVLQALWIGFDSSYLIFYCHEIFKDTMLTVAVNSCNGAIFLGTIFSLIIGEKQGLDWHFANNCLFQNQTLVTAMCIFFHPSDITVYFGLPLSWRILYYAINCYRILHWSYFFNIDCFFNQETGWSSWQLISFGGESVLPCTKLYFQVMYACFAGGIFISSILLEKEEVEIPVHPRTKFPLQIYPVNSTTLSNMNVHSRYPPMIVLIISAAFQVCID